MKAVFTLLLFFAFCISYGQSAVLQYRNDTICSGSAYSFNGKNLTQSGTYRDTLPSATPGIDSIIILSFKVNPKPVLSLIKTNTFCLTGNDTLRLKGSTPYAVSWALNGTSFTTPSPYDSVYIATGAGTYAASVTNSYGCSNTAFMYVGCQSSVLQYRSDTVCGVTSYSFNGTYLTQSGTYRDTLPAATPGMDSIVILDLIVNPKPTLTLSATNTFCQGSDTLSLKGSTPYPVSWKLGGTALTTSSPYDSFYIATISGIYAASVTNSFGCSSTAFKNISCLSSLLNYRNDTICSGSAYSFNGQNLTQSGIYRDTLPSATPGRDSIIILGFTVKPSPSITLSNSNTFCLGSDLLILSGSTPNPVIWKLNDTLFTTPNPYDSSYSATVAGTYSATVINSFGCSDTASIVVSCIDSVWPGDADHNYIADNNDLLPIGIGYNLSGPQRINPSIVWIGQYCANWGLQLLNGTNIKHADCDGNGAINYVDTLAITQNFGLIHPKKENDRGIIRAGKPFLNVVFSKHKAKDGDTIIASIQLGDSSLTVSRFYGVAFTYNYDQRVVDTSKTYISYPPSWIGADIEKMSIRKDFKDIGQIKTAVTRIDHTGRNGFGEIAQVHMVITTDNINGFSMYNNINFISNINAIDSVGNPIELNAGIDSAWIEIDPNGITDVKALNASVIAYPNPVSKQLVIESRSASIKEIVLVNVLGERERTISEPNLHKQLIDVSTLSPGVYFVQIETDKGTVNKRIVIQR